MTDAATPSIPHTLRARLEVIAGAGALGGLPTAGFVTRGDRRLVEHGLVELRGDRMHLTHAGRAALDGRAA